MKTLVILTHPNFEDSVVNKRWIKELSKFPNKYSVHHLYESYPNGIIDINREQRLIEEYDHIIFQFPFYWFNCPPLLKSWLDLVLTYGWAYGSKSGYKVGGKQIGIVLSVGIDEKEYSEEGKYKYSINELLAPFELTFNYIKADYRGYYAYYGIELDSSVEAIENSVTPYINFIDKL